MTFAEALEQMEKGRVVARRAWSCFAQNCGVSIDVDIERQKTLRMVAHGQWISLTWHPTNKDIFSDDWENVEAARPSI